MSALGWLTAGGFLGGAAVAIVALVVWLITMMRDRPIHYSRRVCWVAALVALLSLFLNALR